MNTPTFNLEGSLKSIQEDLDYAALMSSLESLDVSKAMTSQQKFLEELKENGSIKAKLRKPKVQPKPKPKVHWAVKRARRRAARARAYGSEKRSNKVWWEGVLEDPDQPKAWYTWLSKNSTRSRDQKRKGWEITLEEFREHVYPALKGSVPVISRYDLSLGWTLDNTLWVDTATKQVLFCGKEFTLRSLGYIL